MKAEIRLMTMNETMETMVETTSRGAVRMILKKMTSGPTTQLRRSDQYRLLPERHNFLSPCLFSFPFFSYSLHPLSTFVGHVSLGLLRN